MHPLKRNDSYTSQRWSIEEIAEEDPTFSTQELADKIHELEDRDGQAGFSNFEDHLFDTLKEENGRVPLSKFFADLRYMGLRKNDPRLRECMRQTNQLQKHADIDGTDVMMDRDDFKKCVTENLVILKKAFEGEFVIPEFQKHCQILEDIYEKCKPNSSGKVADYIPQLARCDATNWGISVCTVDGQRFSVGDVDVPFSFQSISKPIMYALALNEHGPDHVHQYVGQEPSGESYNYIKLNYQNKPHNAMINAGAIVIDSLVKSDLRMADRFDHVQQEIKKMAGGEFLGFNNAVYLSERESSDRNQAIGYYLQENKCFPEGSNLKATLDLYFQLCSLEATCESASVIAGTFANGGICPLTGVETLSGISVQNTLSMMHSCGMYDYSGQFAFKVGLPAKSSVSGAILLVIPNVMGICMWSPSLDKCGNSCRGIQFCIDLIQQFNFHPYDPPMSTNKIDPVGSQKEKACTEVYVLLFGASQGDLTSLIRMSLSGTDMRVADYDGRTALHLAAAEGHLNCVKFLLERCHVSHSPQDRWQHTPLDEARRFHKQPVIDFLEKYIERVGPDNGTPIRVKDDSQSD